MDIKTIIVITGIASVISACVATLASLLNQRRIKIKYREESEKRVSYVAECLQSQLRQSFGAELRTFLNFCAGRITDPGEKEAFEKLIAAHMNDFINERMKYRHVEVFHYINNYRDIVEPVNNESEYKKPDI